MNEEIIHLENEIAALKVAQSIGADTQFYTYETTIDNLTYDFDRPLDNYRGRLTFSSDSKNPIVCAITYLGVYNDVSDGTKRYYEAPQITTNSENQKEFMFSPAYIESRATTWTYPSYTIIRVLASREITNFSYEAA